MRTRNQKNLSKSLAKRGDIALATAEDAFDLASGLSSTLPRIVAAATVDSSGSFYSGQFGFASSQETTTGNYTLILSNPIPHSKRTILVTSAEASIALFATEEYGDSVLTNIVIEARTPGTLTPVSAGFHIVVIQTVP